MRWLFNGKQRGFSLAEVTMGMGMVGVLTTIIIGLTKQQNELQKRMKVDSELVSFRYTLSGLLGDKVACEQTIGGIGAVIAPNLSLGSIVNNQGDTIYSVGDMFGEKVLATERLYKIISITLKYEASDVIPNPNPPMYRIKNPSLDVVIRISEKVTNDAGNRDKRISNSLGALDIQQRGDNLVLQSCTGNDANTGVQTAIGDICAKIGGTLNADTGVCRLSDYGLYPGNWNLNTNSSSQAVSSQSLKKFMDEYLSIDNWNSSNIILGLQAGKAVETGSDNVYLGRDAGLSSTSADQNTFVGSGSGTNATQSKNTYVGYKTGHISGQVERNTFIGAEAGLNNTSGDDNVFIGAEAGINNTRGGQNIMIGKGASISSTAGITASGSKQINIGNLLLGKLPDSTAGSPNVSEIGSYGLIVNGSLVVKEKIAAKKTVEASEGIKLGHPLVNCNGTNRGLIRYNKVENALELCNRTDWVKLVQAQTQNNNVPTGWNCLPAINSECPENYIKKMQYVAIQTERDTSPGMYESTCVSTREKLRAYGNYLFRTHWMRRESNWVGPRPTTKNGLKYAEPVYSTNLGGSSTVPEICAKIETERTIGLSHVWCCK